MTGIEFYAEDERYPLALKWRRAWPNDDDHFIALDPEECGLSSVVQIHKNTNHTPGASVQWMWQCIAPGIGHVDIMPKMGAWRGYCRSPRPAAWEAEEAYRRYLAVAPPDVHARAVAVEEYWREAREQNYRKSGITI